MGTLNSKKKTSKNDKELIKPEKYKNIYYLTTIPKEITTDISNIVFKYTTNHLDKYELLKELEKGSTASVAKIMNKENNKLIRAVKRISLKENPKLIEDAEKEIAILKILDHPNIMKIYEYYVENNETINIVMELIEGGELFSLVKKKGKLTEEETAKVMYQLFSSIKMVHDSGIIHRDIKLENVLVVDEKELLLKLIDFGSAEILNETKKETNTKIGTPSYIAPEILKGEMYDYSCDLWSLGVVMYFLLCGNFPFKGGNENDTFKLIKTKEPEFKNIIWNTISSEAISLIKSLLVKDKNKRININQALNSSWIQTYINKKNKIVLHNPEFCRDKMISNVLKFKEVNPIQLFFLYYLVHNETDFSRDPLIQQITKEFLYFDEDNDGKLSEIEMTSFFLENNISKEESEKLINSLFDIFGTNKGKYIFYEQFVLICLSEKTNLINDKNIQKMFLYFDQSKNRKISLNEIKNIYISQDKYTKIEVNDDLFDSFYKKLDMTKDQIITYLNFTKYLKSINV